MINYIVSLLVNRACEKQWEAVHERLVSLDAHWEDDLPLRDELEIIAANWSDFVVMIDDFQVPDDLGYGFDQYGEGKNLNLDLIRSVLTMHNLVAFSPSAPASEESGGRRGCVLITRKAGLSREVAGLSAVRPLRAVRPSS